MSDGFYAIRVASTSSQIKGNAKHVVFDVPPHLAAAFTWTAGQHITLRLVIDGEEVRRSYSISSAHDAGDPLRITVKRVEGGLVSNYINDHVSAGDVIDLAPPSGRFVLRPDYHGYRTCYFFGAGSGITPLYAMIRSLLANEPSSTAHLFYGNRSPETTLLADELERLRYCYPERFTSSHVFSGGALFRPKNTWRTGIIDRTCVDAALTQYPPYAQDARYFICGPGGMNTSVKRALEATDVPASRIYSESYGDAGEVDDSVTGVDATIELSVRGERHEVPMAAGETALEAIRRAKIPVPFSCQSGICGSCRAKLGGGRAHMRANMVLDDGEVASGEVLTCQALALTPRIKLSFEG